MLFIKRIKTASYVVMAHIKTVLGILDGYDETYLQYFDELTLGYLDDNE